jgi:hypothetical protein
MLYLIKLIFFLLLICNYSLASENKKNEIIFKINNKVFTNIDLEERKKYVGLINNFSPSNFSESENQEILNDFISSLIFYEYYIQNRKVFKNLNDEIDLVYEEKFQNSKKLNQIAIKKIKLNTKLDLIRNKIIEEKLNSKKKSLLEEANNLDLLYNYKLQNIIIKKNLIDKELITNIDDIKKFNNLRDFLIKNNVNFFYKEENINDNSIISNKIKNIINQNAEVYISTENEYINLLSIKKNLVSYEGIFVKLINFNSKTPFKKSDLKCDKLNETVDKNRTVFKEYEYSKLNNKIKNNLKSINDYILFNENDEYNYIILCDLTYDKKLIKNLNFNKNINSLVKKIQINFLKKYKNEYKFSKIK